jgi:Tfp pilus assembly protein PilW
MLSAARHLRRRLRDERGLTLIETLVAMITGIIVSFALFSILEVSLHQSSRLTDVVQASQLGRTAMTHIVDELHSACIAPGFTPVQEGSEPSKLIFENAYGEAAEPASARKDEIVYEKSAKTLLDKTYRSTGGEYPAFTYVGSAPTTVRLGENITETELSKSENYPIFEYYEYASAASTSPTEASSTLKKMSVTKMTAAQADAVASVVVNFTAGPTSKETSKGRLAPFSSQTTFAFSAPNSESTIEDTPCE